MLRLPATNTSCTAVARIGAMSHGYPASTVVLVVIWGRDVFCFPCDRRKRELQGRDAIDTLDHRRNLRGDCDLRGIQSSTRPQLASIQYATEVAPTTVR